MAASARVKKHIPGQEELQMVQQCGPSQGDTAHTHTHSKGEGGWGGEGGRERTYNIQDHTWIPEELKSLKR